MSETKSSKAKESKSKKGEVQKPKSEPVPPEKLQQYIDMLVTDEHGAEITLNLDTKLGAVADLVFSPEKKELALLLLSSPEAMAYERNIHFRLKDAIFQPENRRLIIRAESLNIYEIKPAESPLAVSVLANYGLTKEEHLEVRKSMINALRY